MCLHSVHRSDGDSQMVSRAATLGVRNARLLEIVRIFDEEIDQEISLDETVERDAFGHHLHAEVARQHVGGDGGRGRVAVTRVLIALAPGLDANLGAAEGVPSMGFVGAAELAASHRRRDPSISAGWLKALIYGDSTMSSMGGTILSLGGPAAAPPSAP